MVSTCANPMCTAPFRYLHEGKLFLVERRNGNGHGNSHRAPAKLEYFWLCSDCASRMTLETERGSGIVRVAETGAADKQIRPS